MFGFSLTAVRCGVMRTHLAVLNFEMTSAVIFCSTITDMQTFTASHGKKAGETCFSSNNSPRLENNHFLIVGQKIHAVNPMTEAQPFVNDKYTLH